MNGPMQGLMATAQQPGGDAGMGMPPMGPPEGGGGNADPVMLLTQALELHKRQSEGGVLNSPETQQELGMLLESALVALTGGMAGGF